MLVVPYNLLDHCILTEFSMFQAKDVTHLVYHFQSFSFDVASYPETNQSIIKHWTPLAGLTYVIYVYFYFHVVKIDNLACYLICTTYMST
jgi:hypothetical protein